MSGDDLVVWFRARLGERGIAAEGGLESFGGHGSDWHAVWETFVEICSEGVTGPPGPIDDDLLLHESGLAEDGTYAVWATRQRVVRRPDNEYGGMVALTLTFICDRAPEGRVPRAQRWGYAGPHRADADDNAHPRIERWAGHATCWASAVEASNSFGVLEIVGPTRWNVQQSPV